MKEHKIRSIEKFMEGAIDFSVFNGCFGRTNGGFTDLDGIIERHGKFLILEKKIPGVSIPTGQRIMLEALIGLGCFTIINFWGDEHDPHEMQLWTAKNGLGDIQDASVEKLRHIIAKWFDWANKQRG